MKLFLERISKLIGGILSVFGVIASVTLLINQNDNMALFFFLPLAIISYPLVVFITKYLLIDTFFSDKVK